MIILKKRVSILMSDSIKKVDLAILFDSDVDDALSFMTNPYLDHGKVTKLLGNIRPLVSEYWTINDEMSIAVRYHKIEGKMVVMWNPSSNKCDWELCRAKMREKFPEVEHRKCSMTQLYYEIVNLEEE